MQRTFIKKRYQVLENNALGESDQAKHLYEDLIDLSLGDPDLNTPQEIIQAAFEDAKKGHTHYTDFTGDPELIAAILKAYEEDYHIQYAYDECMVTTSACHGMWLVMEALLDEGDEIILHGPYFPPYIDQIEMAGGLPRVVDTFESEGFQIDLRALESKITPKTKAILINTPNNPTGRSLSRASLEGLAKIAIERDLLILSDDIYTGFTFEEDFFPISQFEGMKERTITLRSFSKNYCMSGWRLGYILGPDWLIECVKRINEANVFTAPSISQRAGIYALQHRKVIVPEIAKVYKERQLYVYERIKKIKGLSVLPPQGSLYMFVNIKATKLNSEDFSQWLLEKAHVLVLPGHIFGRCGEGYVRLALTVEMPKLMEAMDAIEQALEGLDE